MGFNTMPAAELAASEIPGAELIIYDTGGHLLVGQKEAVRKSIRSFLIAADSTSYDPQAKSN